MSQQLGSFPVLTNGATAPNAHYIREEKTMSNVTAIDTAKNTAPKSDTPTTIKQLHGIVVEKFAAFEGKKAEAEVLGQRVTVLERKSLGITRANAEVAALKQRFDKLTEELKDDMDPAIADARVAELKRMETRLETLFGDLSGRFDVLSATVADHTGQLAEHDERLTEHDGLIEEAKVSAGAATEGLFVLRDRIDAVLKFPTKRLVLSLIVGLIAGLIFNSIAIGANAPTADGGTAFVPYPADHWLVAVLFGVAVFIGLFGLLLILVPRKVDVDDGNPKTVRPTILERVQQRPLRNRKTESASVPPVPVPSEEQRADNATPTEVLPTSSGAAVGTRS